MSLLVVENLTQSFGDKKVLTDVNFKLERGEHVGLVGANGAGKTTLFNILIGDLTPDTGRVSWSNSVRVGHLSQHSRLVNGRTIRDTLREAFARLYFAESELLRVTEMIAQCHEGDTESARMMRRISELQDVLDSGGFYSIDAEIEEAASGLGITALGLDTPVERLSGGQRTKVLLAQLLLEAPDVLLLDEPTNYLDKQHVEWLVEYLNGYSNSFILISHDTGFLNRVINTVYHLEFTQIKRYPGNYQQFLNLHDRERREYIQQYEKQQDEIAKLENFVRKNIARASTTKRAQARRKRLDKIERIERPHIAQRPVFGFHQGKGSSTPVFRSSALRIGYVKPLLPALSLKLERGAKIAITGRNGIGKSTLLKTIARVIPALSGQMQFGDNLELAYFEQEVPAEREMTVLQDVWRQYPNLTPKEIRAALGRSGLKPEMVVMKPVDLSGGEQTKVRLCKLMLRSSNWLLLDEPINHLDKDARLALQDSLRAYQGTVLLVCHETWFFEEWATDVWDVERFAGS